MSLKHVDNLLNQWEEERPEVDCDSLGAVVPIQLLAKLLRRNTGRALRRLKLTTQEYDVLSALRRQGEPYCLGATALAKEVLLSSGALTNRIDGLEQRGLVERRVDPDDRRGVQVFLSDDGLALIDAAIERRVAVADEFLSVLEKDEQRHLVTLLRKTLASLTTH